MLVRWGVNKGANIEKVHLDFCKRLLGARKNTTNVLIYFELGHKLGVRDFVHF